MGVILGRKEDRDNTSDSGARLISSGDTTSGKEFGGNASRGFSVAIDGVGFRVGGSKRHDGIDKVMQDAAKQAPKEQPKKPNFTLLGIIGVFASYGAVETYKSMTKEPEAETATVTTPAQGAVQPDIISRMTFEVKPAGQTNKTTRGPKP